MFFKSLTRFKSRRIQKFTASWGFIFSFFSQLFVLRFFSVEIERRWSSNGWQVFRFILNIFWILKCWSSPEQFYKSPKIDYHILVWWFDPTFRPRFRFVELTFQSLFDKIFIFYCSRPFESTLNFQNLQNTKIWIV